MLVLYSQTITFPGGGLATDYPVTVVRQGSNTGPPMFTDSTGQAPISNPVTADGFGLAQFWAAPGTYVAWVAGVPFMFAVDPSFTDPVTAGVQTFEQTSPENPWTLRHYFGEEPDVLIISDHAVVHGEVTHPDSFTTVIDFGEPVTGVAHLRR